MVMATNNFPSSNGTLIPTTTRSPNSILDLDKGDPMVFGAYWRKVSEECSVVIKGCELMSYISDPRKVCWFMLPEFEDAVRRLHRVVGNAVTKDRHIVVGTGATQLFQAAVFALSPSDPPKPINVVAATPFYSEYQDEVGVLRSGLYQWAGDAALYEKNEAYIEVVTSPNNPDGTIRGPAVVKSEAQGKLVHDFAYYWPHYTPITHQADNDIMIFTFSKCTGHAGSRIGWAIVKDIDVAKKMTRYVQLSSIGVSKESQIRVAKIVEVICNGYQKIGSMESELFFEYSKRIMRERWEKFWKVVEQSKVFSVTKSPKTFCNFTNEASETYAGFIWLKCDDDDIEDCEGYLLGKLKIRSRGGKRFGASAKYARLSMIGTDDEFNELLKR
ncbi:L-tryptophan--pyruvate aminotransferase 1, partial [Mucuna pruriens]